MSSKSNGFSGFLEGFKGHNIDKNKVSLSCYLEIITGAVEELISTTGSSLKENQDVIRLSSGLKSSVNDKIVERWLKFCIHFKFFIQNNVLNNPELLKCSQVKLIALVFLEASEIIDDIQLMREFVEICDLLLQVMK
jgi:hypothetical protein